MRERNPKVTMLQKVAANVIGRYTNDPIVAHFDHVYLAKPTEHAMANEQYAFLNKSSLPTLETWQAAVDAAGFELEIDPELKIGTDSGFVPCALYGEGAGVEMYFDDSEELLSQFSEIAPDKDYCISFRWGGSEIECACAMILSYALAKQFDAIISYEGDTPYASLDSLLTDTQGALKDAGLS